MQLFDEDTSLKVSHVQGVHRDVVARRYDAVVTATPVSTKHQVFHEKLVTAGKHLQRGNSETMRRGAHQQSTSPASSRTTQTTVVKSVGAQAPITKSVLVRGQGQGERQIAPSRFAAYRSRKLKKTLPKQFQEKLSRLTADASLTLVNVWLDPSEHIVTLVVDQDGYSTTNFVIEYANTRWQITVRSKESRDTDTLLAAREKLDSRFEKADLGPVVLS